MTATQPIARIGDFMQTSLGIAFYPQDPRQEEIKILDIAHALSNQCRYAGHTRRHFSVGQHSVLVSRNLPRNVALWGLLHDASEAYLVDLPRPVKAFSLLGSEYKKIEKRLMIVICEKFGLSAIEPPEVKLMDNIVLMTEKRDLLLPSPHKWRESATPLEEKITPWSPARSKFEFMEEFNKLYVG